MWERRRAVLDLHGGAERDDGRAGYGDLTGAARHRFKAQSPLSGSGTGSRIGQSGPLGP